MSDFPDLGNQVAVDELYALWLDELGLSIRTANALYNNDITSFAKLVSLSDSELKELRGMGQKGYQEIQDKLESLTPEAAEHLAEAYDAKILNKAFGSNDPEVENLIQIDDSLVNTPIEYANFTNRTYNALVNKGVRVFGDIGKYTFSELRESFKGIGELGTKEIKAYLSQAPLINGMELHEYLLSKVKANHLEIFDSYYGLTSYSEKKTLAAVANEFNLTRERIRQINKKVLAQISRAIKSKVIAPHVEQAIIENINCRVQELPELSNVYQKEVVLRIYVDAEVLDIALYKNDWLKSEWLVGNDFNMEQQVGMALEALKSQIGPVKIQELANEYSINDKILYDIRKTTITDGLIVLNTNKRATGNDLAFEIMSYMDKVIRPVTISEVCQQVDANLNQVRGLMYRIPGVVNVGLSTYALEKYGYNGKNIIQIVRDLLLEEGQPVHIERIISYVKKYRLVKDGSVPAQIGVNTDMFTRLDEGFYALAEWGYVPRQSVKSSRLEVAAKDAVLDILSNSNKPMSPREVLTAVINKYGSRSTNKSVTISSVLVKMHERGKISKLGTERSPFYFISNGM